MPGLQSKNGLFRPFGTSKLQKKTIFAKSESTQQLILPRQWPRRDDSLQLSSASLRPSNTGTMKQAPDTKNGLFRRLRAQRCRKRRFLLVTAHDVPVVKPAVEALFIMLGLRRNYCIGLPIRPEHPSGDGGAESTEEMAGHRRWWR